MRIVYNTLDPWVNPEKYSNIRSSIQIFRRISKNNKLFVLEENISTTAINDAVEKLFVIIKRPLTRVIKEKNIVIIKKPELWKTVCFGLWKKYQSLMIPRIVNKINPDIYVFNDPLEQIGVLDKLNPSIKIVYDCKDYMPGMTAEKFRYIEMFYEKKILERCDLVVTRSKLLKRKFKKMSVNAVYIPNGVELKEIPKKLRDIPLNIKSPIIGYVGTVSDKRFDKNLFIETAKLLPEYSFLVIGGYIKDRKLPKNVIQLGKLRAREEIFSYINKMDVCWIPYLKNEANHYSCPLKLFEYAALGKPIISTRLNEVQEIAKKYIYFADTPEETVKKIKEALKKGNKKIDRWIKKFDWDKIAEKYEKELKKIL